MDAYDLCTKYTEIKPDDKSVSVSNISIGTQIAEKIKKKLALGRLCTRLDLIQIRLFTNDVSGFQNYG